MFLIETLPTEGKNTTTVATTIKNKSLLMQDISHKIGEELKSIWIPPCCTYTMQKIGDFDVTNSPKHFLMDEKQLIEKLLKIKESKKIHTLTDPVTDNNKSLQEIGEKIEIEYEMDKSLKELKEMAIVLRQKLDTLESEKNMMQVEYSQVKFCLQTANKSTVLQSLIWF